MFVISLNYMINCDVIYLIAYDINSYVIKYTVYSPK